MTITTATMRLYTKVVPEPSELEDLPSPDPATPPQAERHSHRHHSSTGTPQAHPQPAVASQRTPAGSPALEASVLASGAPGTGSGAGSGKDWLGQNGAQSRVSPWSSRGQRGRGFRGGLRSGWPLVLSFEEPEDVNKNTAWFSSPGVWSTYVLVVLLVWLLLQAALGCSVASAWAAVNVLHFVITFYLFHWVKGSPFAEDQGLYDKLTWWEQMDGGQQHTMNRKFMLLVPVLLYVVVSMATRDSEHSSSLLLINTVLLFVLVIAKLPALHRIRILGINA